MYNINYRLDIGVLKKNNVVFSIPDSTVEILSPSDGLCVWKCLAHMAWTD